MERQPTQRWAGSGAAGRAWGLARVAALGGVLAGGPARAVSSVPVEAQALRQQVEADWLLQARSSSVTLAAGDAAGAVDGVKNGRYAFHTGHEPNPWWQVDLGQAVAIGRVVVYNRLDYAPGLHNADALQILTSDDGRQWTPRYDNQGRYFGGVGSETPPLEVPFAEGAVTARHVRLQVRTSTPLFFHLDEVEVYSLAAPQENVARGRPATQSSTSQWSTSKIDPATLPLDYRFDDLLARARRLAAHLHAEGVDTRPYEEELAAVAARRQALGEAPPDAEQRQLYLTARWALRRLAFANPLLAIDRLLFVKRFTQQTYPDICLNHMPWVSRPGGDVCILHRPFAADGAGQRVEVLLDGALGPGHVHGLDLAWDADRVVFGYARAKSDQPPFAWPPDFCRERYLAHDLRETQEPTRIFEMATDGTGVRQLTRDPYWSDLDPTYLPNGHIAFVSERCGTSLQCNHDPNLHETSCNLYVMAPDGSGIRRLSVNKDGDYLPHALADGTIGYTRWEYHERGLAQIQSLWSVRPDGTWADAIFKQHLNDPWALEDVRSIPDSGVRKLVAIAAGHHTLAAGPVVVITPTVSMNGPQAMHIVTPGVLPPEGGMSGTPVAEGGVHDAGGYYMTPWPLSERFFLVAYSPQSTSAPGLPDYCRGNDETGYALYLIDVFGNKELLYRDPAISSSLPIPLRPRPRPPVLPDLTDPKQSTATCILTEATYGVPGVERGRARYLRIAEPVPWPYTRQTGGQRYEAVALSAGLGWTPVRVLGTVPVEADGSAYFQVPVDTGLYFQLLDEQQMEIRRMRSFISFQPGESRSCVGCHESRLVAPLASPKPLALRRAPSVPVPPPWGSDRAVSFLRDVQPVLDRHCVSCHGGLKPAGGLDFSGGLTAAARLPVAGGGEVNLDGHNTAYRTLLTNRLVAWSNKGDPASVITAPLAYGARRSRLLQALVDGPCAKRVTLTPDDWQRLIVWADANVPYHDRFLVTRNPPPTYDLPADQELQKRLAAVHQRRCASCHKPDEVTRLEWVDLRQPAASRFLAAPLAKAAGGLERCGQPVYSTTDDPDYQAVRESVEAAVRRAWAEPRRDLRSLLTAAAPTDGPTGAR